MSGPSVKDVARAAGVSAMTVSNVINGGRPVATATRARVEQAIADLGYRPNVSARRLRGGRSGIVALAVPWIDTPYFAELARHAITAAEERSWTLLINQTAADREHERRVLAGIREQLIDGLIFFPQASTAADLRTRRSPTPLVLLGDHGRAQDVDAVVIDNVRAARDATAHLIELGRRRIAVIGGRSGRGASDVERLRLRGFTEALRRAGLQLHAELVRPVGSFHRDEGATAMAELLALAEPPDAVFCLSDLLALGALHAAYERGFAVPGQVAIIGFDDIEDSRFSNPPLSTVSPDKQNIATTAVRLLADRIEARGAAPGRHLIAHRLIPRASTTG